MRSWYLAGTHYSRTLEDWLKLQDKNAKSMCPNCGTDLANRPLRTTAGLKELRADALANGRTEAEAVATFHR